MQSTANILDYSSKSKAWQENNYISSWDVRNAIWCNTGNMKGNKATMRIWHITHMYANSH